MNRLSSNIAGGFPHALAFLFAGRRRLGKIAGQFVACDSLIGHERSVSSTKILGTCIVFGN